MTPGDTDVEHRLAELFDSPLLDVRPRAEATTLVLRGVRRRRRTRVQLATAGSLAVLAAALFLPQLPPANRTSAGEVGSPASAPPSISSSSPDTLTMSGAAVGPLELGMSREQATATGLLRDPVATGIPGCTTYTGRRGINWATIGPHGLEAIDVTAFVATSEGLQVGDRFGHARQLYPAVQAPTDWKAAPVSAARAPVPASPGAWYLITIDASHVTTGTVDDARVAHLALVAATTSCSPT